MFKRGYTTLYWIGFWAILSIVFNMIGTDWGIIASVIAAVILVAGVLCAFGKWLCHKLVPLCEAHFVIPDKQRAIIPYVQQDNREHKTNCLILPPDSEVPVLLVMSQFSCKNSWPGYLQC